MLSAQLIAQFQAEAQKLRQENSRLSEALALSESQRKRRASPTKNSLNDSATVQVQPSESKHDGQAEPHAVAAHAQLSNEALPIESKRSPAAEASSAADDESSTSTAQTSDNLQAAAHGSPQQQQHLCCWTA